MATQSFSPAPLPSTRTIRLPGGQRQKPIYKAFLAAFIGVFVLILLGGSHNAVALGFALLLPGALVLLRPPEHGLGKLGDLAVVGFLGCLLFAFLPQFYWPDADWRVTAQESFGMNLPFTLSVQPWISLEAWFMALAGFVWFYAALQLRVNFSGRRWLHFYLCIAFGVLAGIVVWGNLAGARYPGAETSNAFSFFPNRNQTANFIMLGGIAGFMYAMTGLRYRAIMPLVGIPCTALCLAGLVLGVARAGVLLYFLGIVFWVVAIVRNRGLPKYFKIAIPVAIVALSVVVSSNQKTVDRITDFIKSDAKLADDFRLKVYEDTSKMVLDAPLTGFGLGSFSAVFPQYRDASATPQRAVHPESDLFWLAAEGGVLAVLLFGLFLGAYFWNCRGLSEGPSGTYRVIAAIALLLFLIHSLVDVPAHRPGTVYLAILFAALALPRSGRRAASWFRPLYWRLAGSILVLIGFAWIVSGLFGLPIHSTARQNQYQESIRSHTSVADYERAKESVDDWIAFKPMDWRAYFQRAQLTLSEDGNLTAAAADFRRARFVEPILGVVSYEEGSVWLEYDSARAMAAWRETLFREIDGMDGKFLRMAAAVRSSPKDLERMGRLSEIDPHYRTLFLRTLSESDLLSEMRREIAGDPSLGKFTPSQRSVIVKRWITHSDVDSAEAFLESGTAVFEDEWWLWSLLRKSQANFEDAVRYIRESVEVPQIPEVRLGENDLERLTREFAVAPKDVMKGTALLKIYVDAEDYEKALPVLERMLEGNKPPLYLHYWHGECLYRLDEYIESWYAFEVYLEKLWETPQALP